MMEKLVVIGAGQMGGGIAQVAALAGYQVQLIDIHSSQLEQAKINITRHLERQQQRKIISSEQVEVVKENLIYASQINKAQDTHLVIEAVSEDLSLKQKVLTSIASQVSAQCIIASNTSSLSITQLASRIAHPQRVIGLHFMNPVPLMQLVEVIPGLETSEGTVKKMKELVSTLNKTLVEAKDYPGFIVNRILMPMINEAIYTLYEGIATAEDIDTAMKLGTNQPLGPLALADLIGLDTCLSIMQVLHQGFNDSKYRPCPLLVNYVNAGWLGRKNGKGFYCYS